MAERERPTISAIRSVFFDADVLQQVNFLVSDARERATFVTPYLGLGEHLKSKIDEAVRKKVQITLLIRTDQEERVPRRRRIEDTAWLTEHGLTPRKEARRNGGRAVGGAQNWESRNVYPVWDERQL